MTSIQIVQLRDLLTSLGISIDSDIADEIKKHIFNGQPSFCLDTDTLLGEAVRLGIRLTFTKSAEPQDYILLTYRVTYHIPNEPTNNRSQTFDMTGGMPVNLNEAFNLLQGRAVFKEISPAFQPPFPSQFFENGHLPDNFPEMFAICRCYCPRIGGRK